MANQDAVNPEQVGTKAAAHYVLDVPAGGESVVRLRLRSTGEAAGAPAFGPDFESTFAGRKSEADEFYDRIMPPNRCPLTSASCYRQALAGMLWSKQFYLYDVDQWLKEHDAHPLLSPAQRNFRNADWFHMFNGDIISMPDKWEYPWYAAWDLAFHTTALSLVDFDFAKEQLLLMLRSLYSHPNGQIPAYEWNFSDVNPPVHAWATLFLFRAEQGLGRADLDFLETLVPRPGAQLQLVAQSQGSAGPQRLRRRLPGPRQHRRLRSQLAAAHRRQPGAGRRNRVDGFLLPEHDRDRADPGRQGPALRGVRLHLRSALHVDRLRDGPHRRQPGRDVGRGRTASTTTCCACPTALRSGSRCARWSACCRCARARRSIPDHAGQASAAGRADRADARALPGGRGPGRADSADGLRSATTAAACSRRFHKSGSSASWATCSTRTSSLGRSGFDRCQSTTRRTRSRSMPAAHADGELRRRRERTRACSAATPTGAVPCGCQSTG